MEMEEIVRTLTAVDQQARNNTRRLDALEKSTETLNRLATSMEVMVTKQDVLNASVEKLSGDVELLKAEPGKRWKFVVEKAIYFLVAAVTGFILARMGL